MFCRKLRAALELLIFRVVTPQPQTYRVLSSSLCAVQSQLRRCGPFPPARRFHSKSSPAQNQQHRRCYSTPPAEKTPEPTPEQERELRAKLLRASSAPTTTAISAAKGITGQYHIYGVTEKIFKACAAPADYTITDAARKADEVEQGEDGEEIGISVALGSGGRSSVWHNELGLQPTFSTWAHVTMLHLWLLTVRFRAVNFATTPNDSDAIETQRRFQNTLADHFFHAAEAKMEGTHALSSGALRQRYLQDLFGQWRGCLLAYDEGLARNDAALAAAVWRNLYKARADVSVRRLAAVVGWLRGVLLRLERKPDQKVLWETPEREFEWIGAEGHETEVFGLVDLPARELAGEFGKGSRVWRKSEVGVHGGKTM